MGKGDLTIHQTTHLPSEKTLLVHYTVNETGSWIYSLCHCGYRGVCEDDWTIMIPNHQHPQHTDARPSQRLQIIAGGRQGIFAWNYGGIVGVASEDFDSDHSYLAQLTMQKDCSPFSGGGNSGKGSTRTRSTGSVPGFTGKGGGGGTPIPPLPPFAGGGPPAAVPATGLFPPDLGPSGSGNKVDPVGPYTIPRTDIPVIPGGLYGGTDPGLRTSPAIPRGILRDPNIGIKPISLYPQGGIGGPIQIVEHGMNYRTDPIRSKLPGGDELDGGGKILDGEKRRPGVDDTVPDNWQDVNAHGFHYPAKSWLFGDGKTYAKEGDPDNLAGIADNVIDLSKFYSKEKLHIRRDHNPDGSDEKNLGLNFPVVSSLPLRPGSHNVGLGIPGEEPVGISLNTTSALLGGDSLASRTYSSDGPTPSLPGTVDVGDSGETILVLSSTSLVQSEKLNVSSIFLPPTEGATIRVKGTLVATDSQGHSYEIIVTDYIDSSSQSPAGISADIRTDKFALGKLSITAIYRDLNRKTVGIATETVAIVQSVAEGSGDIIDVYTDRKRDDISVGLKNLTQVADQPLTVIIPQRGERSLIVVPVRDPADINGPGLLAKKNVSLVLSAKLLSTVDVGMKATMYDVASSSESQRIGSPLVELAPTNTQAVKKPGTIILKTETPALVNNNPSYADEHIIGHTPITTTSDEIVVNLHKFKASAYQENNFFLYLHKDLKLKTTSRTSLSRSGTTVTAVYDTPFSVETVKLLVIGFRGDAIPSTVTFVEDVTEIDGTLTLKVTATKEHYISLLSYPYRLGQDEFYTELLDG